MILRNLKNKWLIAIMLIVGCICSVYFYFIYLVNKTNTIDVKSYLSNLIIKGSDSLYNFTIGDFIIDPTIDGGILTQLDLRINLNKFEALREKNLLPNILVEGTVDTIRLTNIEISKLLGNTKDVVIDEIKLSGTNMHLYQYSNKIKNRPGLNPTKYLYNIIKPGLNNITIRNINIDDCKVTFDPAGKLDKKNPFWKFDNLDLRLHDFRIDSTSALDTSRVLYSSYIEMIVKQFKIKTPDDLYKISVDTLNFDSREGNAHLQNILIQPLTDAKGFFQKKKFAAGMLSVAIPNILLNGLNMNALLTSNSIFADQLILKNGNIKILKDKTKGDPKVSKNGKYLNQLLGKLKINLHIPQINILNQQLTYSEINTKTGKPGHIYFEDINGVIKNLTNTPFLNRDKWITFNCAANFMKSSPLNLSLAFDMADTKSGRFKLQYDLENLHSYQINELLTNLALAKMESFYLKKLIYSGTGSTEQLTGSLNMNYTDLKIALLKNDKETNEIAKNKSLSFLANFIKIIDENPHNGKERISKHLQTTRPYHKGFFALLWFNLMDNMLEIIMKGDPPEKIKKKRK